MVKIFIDTGGSYIKAGLFYEGKFLEKKIQKFSNRFYKKSFLKSLDNSILERFPDYEIENINVGVPGPIK